MPPPPGHPSPLAARLAAARGRRILARGIALALLAAARAAAADFHVSSSQGDDRLNGRSPTRSADGRSGPVATLQALARLAPRGGDRVLLRCGERFTGPLTLALADRGAVSLVISSYGDCARDGPPVIDGRRPAGLRAAAGGALQTLAAPEAVALVYAGDEPLRPALWPREGWLVLPPGTAPQDARLPELPLLAGRGLAAAQLRARTQDWHVEERVLQADGRLDAPLRYPLRPATGFVLAGKGWMVEPASGRFAWDAEARRLVLAVPVAAAGRPIAVVPTAPLLRVSGRGSLLVDGVAFEAAGGDAISVHLDGEVAIRAVRVREAAGNGVAIAGAPRAEVSGSRIERTGLDGIFFAEAARVEVRDNTVIDAGLFGGPRPALAAINAHRTDAARIERNRVDGSAYIGIRFSGDALVRGNVVTRTCRLLSDCAGLYTWRRNADDERPPTRIIGNVVFDADGDTQVKTGVNDWFVGIYADDFSNAVEITGNVVAGVNQGIYVHNAWGVTVTGNVVRARQRPLIDASDPAKVPRVRQRPNRFADNDDRKGDHVIDVQGDTVRIRPVRGAAAAAAEAGWLPGTCAAPPPLVVQAVAPLWRVLDCP